MSTATRNEGGLLEREGELAAASDLLLAAAGGRGGCLLVEGPAGIGKTALLGEIRARASASGLRVLTAAGRELERDFPFGVARQLLERETAGRTLEGAAALALHALGPPDAAGEAAGGLFPPVHGLYWLAVTLAGEAPVALVVDDAHLADHESLAWLAYLAARLEELPLALVVATRDGRAASDREELAAIAARALRLAPAPLGATGVEGAVRGALRGEPDAAFVRAVLDSTGGNPFLVTELLREAQRDGLTPTGQANGAVARLRPETVRRTLVERLVGLGADAAELGYAVAVLGRSTPEEAATLAGLDASAAARAADALRDAGILAPGEQLAPAHPLVREALYESLPPGRRGIAHAVAARQLASRGAAAEAVAAHLLASAPDGSAWAVARLVSAADLAAGRGAPAAAAALLRRALREPPPAGERAGLLGRLGAMEELAGEDEAAETYRAALALEDDPARRAALGLGVARTQLLAGRIDDARATLLDAEADVPEGPGGRELRLQIAARLLTAERLRRRDGFSLPGRLRVPASELTADTPGERALLADLALERVTGAAPVSEAAALAGRALAGERLLADDGPSSMTFLNALMVLVLSDHLDTAADVLAGAERYAARTGDVAGHVTVLAFRAHATHRAGEVGRAVGDLREAAALAQEHRLVLLSTFAVGFLLYALVDVAALDEADALLTDLGLDTEVEDLLHLSTLLVGRGYLRLAQGRIDDAVADLLLAGERLRRDRIDNPALGHWRSLAAPVIALRGDPDAGRELAEEELRLARAVSQPRLEGIALRSLAYTQPPGEGLATFREATAVLAASPDRLQEAHALADLGGALLRSGHRAEAREPLRRSLDLARRIGAAALEGRARALLTAAGARPRRAALSGVDALTPAELRCARMAARGMANREIAEALFVTLRAVESNLTGAYRKLGIGSRAELGPALERTPGA